jgi:hypothetical protein
MYLYIVSPYTKAIRTYVRTYTALRRFSLLSAFIYFIGEIGIIILGFSFVNYIFLAIFWKKKSPNFWYHKKVWYGVYRRNPCFLRLVFIPSCIHTSSVFIHNLYVRTYVHRAALAFPSLWASLRLSCVRGSVVRIARSLARWVRLLTLWQRRK